MDEFTGNHEQTMDDRGRVAFPARMMDTLRKQGGVAGEDPVDVVVTVMGSKGVVIYSKQGFARHLEKLAKLAETSVAAQEARKNLMWLSEDQTLDKQNRFRIPPKYVKLFGLKSDILVLGNGDHVKIVNNESWDVLVKDAMEKLDNAAALLPGFG